MSQAAFHSALLSSRPFSDLVLLQLASWWQRLLLLRRGRPSELELSCVLGHTRQCPRCDDVLLDILGGICFLVTVVEQQVVCVCDWVVRGDDACEDAVSGKVLAYFGIDESIACCAETVVVVISIMGSLSCLCFEGDRCLTDSCGTLNEHDLPHREELQDNSDESFFDPETPAPAVIQSAEIDDIQPEPDSDSDEEHMIPAVTEPPRGRLRGAEVLEAMWFLVKTPWM
jgi:hypothetical protein